MLARLLFRRTRSAVWRPSLKVGWVIAEEYPLTIAVRLNYLEVLVELGEAIRPRVNTDPAAVDALNSCIHSVCRKIFPLK